MSELQEAIERAKAAAGESTPEQVTTEETVVQNETPETETPVATEVATNVEDEDDGMIIAEDESVAASNQSILTASLEETKASVSADDDLAALKAELTSTNGSNNDVTIKDSEATGYVSKNAQDWKELVDAEVSKLKIDAEEAKIEATKIYELLMARKHSLQYDDLSMSEVDELLSKRLDREIEALASKYNGKNTTVVINVPSEAADKIEFTEAQQQKIEKSSKIQLVQVEKKELGTLKLKNVNKKENKLKFIEKVNNKFISTYSTPLPLTAEFATFRGALLIELLQARVENGEMLQETVNKKASLAYKHYVEGITHKIKEDGKTVMTYNDFVNKFRYHDLDLMMYAITCASSGPMTVSDLTCSKCGEVFTHEFSVSSLLVTDNFPEKIRKLYEDIIKHRSQLSYIETLQKEHDELLRVQSPITKNIYDIGAPSIARAVSLLNSINPDDPTDIYILALALFTHSVFIYDDTDGEGEYVPFTDEESDGNYDDLISVLKMMPQNELTMLHDVSVEMSYTAEFIMKSKCPHCGTDLVNNIPINDLVFFVTPETPVETEKK